MLKIEQTLIKCFSAVFPEVPPEEIVKANQSSVEYGDSLTAVRLMVLILEEFGIDLEPDGVPEDLSFEGILARVTEAVHSKLPIESAHG
jgi:acyl carrier protein